METQVEAQARRITTLVAALKFYAHPKHWYVGIATARMDRGKRARRALRQDELDQAAKNGESK